jgi:hypothetical protein
MVQAWAVGWVAEPGACSVSAVTELIKWNEIVKHRMGLKIVSVKVGPLLLILIAPLQHPFLHLIVFPCLLRSCSPPLIYDELYRPLFVPVLIKDIYVQSISKFTPTKHGRGE